MAIPTIDPPAKPTAYDFQQLSIASIVRKSMHPDGHKTAEALSNMVQALHPEFGMPTQRGVQGYWLPADRHMARALTASVATAGGNLVGAAQVGSLVAAARPRTVLQEAGAVVVNVTGSGEYTIPSWKQNTGATWLAEGAAAPQADLQVNLSTATPKIAGVRLVLSRKVLLQGLDGLEDLVRQELQRSGRALAEQGFFAGTGSTNQPRGILNTPDTTAQSFASTMPVRSELSGMVDKYLAQQGDFAKARFFLNPATFVTLMNTEAVAAGGRYLAEVINGQPTILGIPVSVSNAITAAKVILCDPTRLALVFWASPVLLVDSFSAGKGIRGEADIICLNYTDIIPTRPAEIVVGTN